MAIRTPERATRPTRTLVFDVGKPWREQTPETLQFSLPRGVTIAPGSWSADGRKVALAAVGADASGVYLYDFATQRGQQVSELAEVESGPRWLSDSRRLVVGYQGGLYLINPGAGKPHKIVSVFPDAINGYSLSRDDRLIVYGVRNRKADIWLASLEGRSAESQQ